MAVGAGSTEYAFWHALFAAASMAVSATGNSLSTPTLADGLCEDYRPLNWFNKKLYGWLDCKFFARIFYILIIISKMKILHFSYTFRNLSIFFRWFYAGLTKLVRIKRIMMILSRKFIKKSVSYIYLTPPVWGLNSN